MDSEQQKTLQRVLELSEENNKILKKMARSMRWARLFRMIYFVIIIGSAIGIFYYMQPFVDQILGAYGGARESFNNIGNIFK